MKCACTVRGLSPPPPKPTASPPLQKKNHPSAPLTQRLIYDAGAVAPLVQWLVDSSKGPPDVAANALSDLAHGHAEMQSDIKDAGSIDPLVAMLELTHPLGLASQRAAADALATLAADNSACQVAIARAGGIPPLVELLKKGKPGCHKDAAHAVAMLAGDEDNKMQIAHAGGIGPLVALLSTGDSETQRYAALALEWLASDCAENQVVLANEKASAPLVTLLGSDSIETQVSRFWSRDGNSRTPHASMFFDLS